jgi:hypothetical protein
MKPAQSLILFRAFAFAKGSDELADEVMVWFESSWAGAPADRLRRLLAQAWNVPAARIDFYNLASAPELLADWSVGHPSTGDARLLEIGTNGHRVLYAEERNTLILTRPATLQRLLSAQQAVRVINATCSAEHYAALLRAHLHAAAEGMPLPAPH